MRLLLDTHVALWAILADRRLPKVARDLIADGANEVFVSAASIWEISIKHGLARGRKTDMPISGEDARSYFSDAGYGFLPISPVHAAAVESLPPINSDPFDRMLVAQALTEPLRLLTHDRKLIGYGSIVQLV